MRRWPVTQPPGSSGPGRPPSTSESVTLSGRPAPGPGPGVTRIITDRVQPGTTVAESPARLGSEPPDRDSAPPMMMTLRDSGQPEAQAGKLPVTVWQPQRLASDSRFFINILYGMSRFHLSQAVTARVLAT